MARQLIARFEKRFPGGIAVAAALDRPVDAFSITVLLGPSGGGKTITLRCLAGLDRPDDGAIHFGDETWFDAGRRVFLGPQRRIIGYLTQEYALFPHLNVADNVGFGLMGLPRAERRQRVAEALALVRIAGLETAKPHHLSGGQRQRVALARTLARRPRLVLLDEPLSALDAATREELRPELRSALAAARAPVILVTHDRAEAAGLADHLVVVAGGRVLQQGPAGEVLNRPADAAVARVVGIETVQPGRVIGTADGLATVAVGSTHVVALAPSVAAAEVLVCIRGEDVLLVRSDVAGSARNHLPALVTGVVVEGALARVALDAGFPLTALVTRPSVVEMGLVAGARVLAFVKAPAVHLIPRSRRSQ